ncbi:BMP family protein [Thermoflexus sp.]|uniref:BMP family lipoprotein n=1 Tax=Thermoflexus sp. TaxID=1969742 RepID=UPI0035E43252
MRRWPGICLVGLLLIAGCIGRGTTPRPSLTATLLLVQGVEGDQGPFEFAAAGAAAFRRSEGVDVPLLALGEDPIAWEGMIRAAAREPAHRLLLIGMEGPARLGLEQARLFPGKRFVLLGLAGSEEIPPNVLAIAFHDWEAGWLAGYIAGHLADPERGRRVGALAGPGPSAALEGYRCGARAAGVRPEDLLVERVDADPDPAAGFEAALRLYQQGADIVLGLAGGSSAGLFEAAAAVRRHAIGFGIDWGARYRMMRSPAAEALLGSVTPAVGEAVRRVLRQSRRGELPFGARWTLGLREGGLEWRGTPTFFRIAPAWLQRQIRDRALRPAPCGGPGAAGSGR